ncbi:hypothetical protein GCM10010350_73370 [Streptomyces galilaeus]|nr:hypothetical protein GCM10010350_73370 [Streptomyces galilaeus]
MPTHLQIHLIVDNYGTHKTPAIKAWLAKHPRFELHFTPTGSSWINQVERWFGYLAHQMIRRGAHKNICSRGTTTVLDATGGLQNPTSVALRGKDVYVLSAAYTTGSDPNLLRARLRTHR